MTEMHASPGSHRDPGGAVDPNLATVSIADLLARRVALEWFESVAILAGLCSTLAEKGTTGVPAPPDILLSPDGAIVVGGPAQRHEDDALPRVLHELLAVVPPPTALRLFVLHAISSSERRSPAAFGKALEYYERPERDAVIRAVRQKYFETPLPLPGSAAPQPFELPAIEPKQLPSPEPVRRRPRRVAVVLALCACAVVVVITVGNGRSGRSSRTFSTVDALLAHTAEAGRSVVRAIADSLSSPVDNAPGEDPTTSEPKTPVVTSEGRRRRPRTESTHESVAATGPEAATLDELETGAVQVDAVPADEAPIEHPVVVMPVPVPEVVDDKPLDAADTPSPTEAHASVIPPRLLEPIRLPPWVDPVNKESLSAIELQIGTDGTVERVRMLSPAMRMTDMMILSAAKTWVFEPASLEGRPVPYRLTLSLSADR